MCFSVSASRKEYMRIVSCKWAWHWMQVKSKLLLSPHVGRKMQKLESQARRGYTEGPDSAQENLQLLLLLAGSRLLPLPVSTGNHTCITALKEVAGYCSSAAQRMRMHVHIPPCYEHDPLVCELVSFLLGDDDDVTKPQFSRSNLDE